MKLAEAIDLFQRRFAFHVAEHHLEEAHAYIQGDNVTFYIHCRDVLSDPECIKLQTTYMRLVEDYPNINVKVISDDKWSVRNKWICVWSADGSVFSGPRA